MMPGRMYARLGQVLSPSEFILTSFNSRRLVALMKLLMIIEPTEISRQLTFKEYVVIRHSGFWERAVTYKASTRQDDQQWLHHLLLVDRGILTDSYSAYETLPEIFENQPCIAFQFALDGIVPSDALGSKNLWSSTAFEEVFRLLSKKKLTTVVNRKPTANGIFFGDIIFDDDTSLSCYLLDKKYAAYDPTRFKAISADESLSHYSDLLKVTAAMAANCNNDSDVSSNDSFKTARNSISVTSSSKCSTVSYLKSIATNNSISPPNSALLKRNKNIHKTLDDSRDDWLKGPYQVLIRKPVDEPFIKPVRSVLDSSLTETMRKALKQRQIKYFKPVTANALPAIARGRNTVIIGGKGKTTSCVVGIIDKIFAMQESEIPSGRGPLAVFLCNGSRNTQVIYKLVSEFLSLSHRKFTALQIVGSSEKKMRIVLANGCDILITTPHCITRLLHSDIWTNLQRLKWLVVDDADALLMPPFREEMEILRLKMKRNKLNNVQWVIVGNTLTSPLRQWIQSLENLILLIASHIEAALCYSNAKVSVTITKMKNKLSIMSGWLKKHQEAMAVIVCRIPEEVDKVAGSLREKGWKPLVAGTGTSIEMMQVQNNWNNRTSKLLVCSDYALNHLEIRDASVLVHYSLPEKHKNALSFRFSLCMDNVWDHYQPHRAVPKLKTLLFFDESVGRQVPAVVNILKRVSRNIDDSLLQLAELSWLEGESKKLDENLCYLLLNRGVCNREKCAPRHVINIKSDSMDHRFRGEVVFHQVIVDNGCTFFAKWISTEDAAGNIHKFPDCTADIQDALKKYFSTDRPVLANITRGSLCVCYENGEYFRSRILSVQDRTALMFIDTGKVKYVARSEQLFEIPDEIASYPDQIVKMYLAGLLPLDHDEFYDSIPTQLIQKLFDKPLQSNQHWRATICAAFKSGVVVDKVRVVSWMKSVGAFVDVGISPACQLLANNLAITNENHLPLLAALCDKAGFQTISKAKKLITCVNPTWAHFIDVDFYQVLLPYVPNSHKVFLVKYDLHQRQVQLEKLCSAEGEALLETKEEYDFQVGNVCLAKTPDGWNRARIEEINGEAACCLLVDYGEIIDIEYCKLVPISDSLINQLSFQAIECILDGVKFSDSDQFHVRLMNLTEKVVYAVPEKLEIFSQLTGELLYKITLFTQDGIFINKQLVDENVLEVEDENSYNKFVTHLEEISLFFESATQLEQDSEESDLDEKVKEIYTEELNDIFRNDIIQNVPAIPAVQCNVVEKNKNEDDPFEGISVKSKEALCKLLHEVNEEVVTISPKGLQATIYWSDQNSSIKLKCMVAGVQKVQFWASCRYFRIRMINSEGAEYLTEINLFGVINCKSIKHVVTPGSVDVICAKMVPLPWPQLTAEKISNGKFIYDAEAITVQKNKPSSHAREKGRKKSDSCSGDEDLMDKPVEQIAVEQFNSLPYLND